MSEIQAFLQKYGHVLPKAIEWLNNTLNYYKPQIKRFNEFGFSRIPKYFSKEVLDAAKIVIVDRVPNMPLYSQWGIAELKAFEDGNYQGVSYVDTIFIQSGYLFENLFFHELVHLIQWRQMGVEKFLIAYGLEQIKYGYPKGPLEGMAYGFENIFKQTDQPFQVEDALKPHIAQIISDLK